MSNKNSKALPYLVAASGLAAFLFVDIVLVPAQQGPPIFSGSDVGWVSVGGEWTPLPGSPQPVKQDPAYAYVPNNVGGQPTFRMADISNSNLTQFARDALRKANDDVLAGKPMWSRSARCWATGVPAFLLTPVQPMFFIQTQRQVTIIAQHDNDVRRIYMDVPHSESPNHLGTVSQSVTMRETRWSSIRSGSMTRHSSTIFEHHTVRSYTSSNASA
jgi:hypothetical protein